MPWDTQKRLTLLPILISLGLISGILLSWKLWLTERAFPHFPVWSFLGPLPAPFDSILVIVLIGLTAVWAIKRNRTLSIVLLTCMLVIALQDQMRWQPWFYQYLLMIVPFAFAAKSAESAKAVLSLQQLIVAMVYLWGGIHKCHAGFIDVFQGSLLAPITNALESGTLSSSINAMAYIVPPVEIFVGVGLLFNRTRNSALVCGILTHMVILILLGPVKGQVSNSVIWPWNFAMIGMLVLLFYKAENFSPAFFLSVSRFRLPSIVIVFLAVMSPALFYLGAWDRYLSFNLYSGWQKRLYIRVANEAVETLPIEYQNHFIQTNALDGHKVISATTWSSRELNVPMITEWRIFRKFAHEFSQYDSGNNEIIFLVDYRNLPNVSKKYYRCDQIKEMTRSDFFAVE